MGIDQSDCSKLFSVMLTVWIVCEAITFLNPIVHWRFISLSSALFWLEWLWIGQFWYYSLKIKICSTWAKQGFTTTNVDGCIIWYLVRIFMNRMSNCFLNFYVLLIVTCQNKLAPLAFLLKSALEIFLPGIVSRFVILGISYTNWTSLSS